MAIDKAPLYSNCHKILLNPWPTYIIELGGDFNQGKGQYKSTSDTQWTPEHSWTSDRPQKKQTSQLLAVVLWYLLMKLSIGNENHY